MSDQSNIRRYRQQRIIRGPNDVYYGVDVSSKDPTEWRQFGDLQEQSPQPKTWLPGSTPAGRTGRSNEPTEKSGPAGTPR